MVEYESPDSHDAADGNSAEPPISEAELTALALKDPPPDDFKGSETKQQSPLSEPSGTGIVWLIGFLVIGIVGVLFVYFPKPPTHEIARRPSPDGAGDAILMELPQDVAGLHSYRVCMQRSSGIKLAPQNCREVAYLGGVSSEAGSRSVTLIWNTSSQLEIRYVHAASIHVYQPVFTWSTSRYTTQAGSMRPILIQAVQTGHEEGSLPTESR